MDTKDTPSEFGGRPGLIQREEDGHVLTPAEKLMLLHQTDPMDPDAYVPE